MSESDNKVIPKDNGSIKVDVGDALEGFHDHTTLKEKRDKGGKPVIALKSGDSLYRDTGEWNKVEQVVDRTNENDTRFRKTIINSNGDVVRKDDEPLPNHQGHGSAKWPKRGA